MRAWIAALMLAACGPAFALKVYDVSLVSDITGSVAGSIRVTLDGEAPTDGTMASSEGGFDMTTWHTTLGFGFDTASPPSSTRGGMGVTLYFEGGELVSIEMGAHREDYPMDSWPGPMGMHESMSFLGTTYQAASRLFFTENPERPDPAFVRSLMTFDHGRIELAPTAQSSSRMALASPIPEPAAAALMLAGVAVLLARRRL